MSAAARVALLALLLASCAKEPKPESRARVVFNYPAHGETLIDAWTIGADSIRYFWADDSGRLAWRMVPSDSFEMRAGLK